MLKNSFKFILPLMLFFSLAVSSQLDSVLETNKERTSAATSSQAKIDSTQIKTDKASTGIQKCQQANRRTKSL